MCLSLSLCLSVSLSVSLCLTVDFARRPGYATVVVPFLRSLGVVVMGAGKNEIDARAAGAELRRWINRAVTQASGVTAAGPQVAAALQQLQQLHGPKAPPVPNSDFTSLAAHLQPAAEAMKQTVQDRTAQAEAALRADKEEVRATPALLKLDAGALEPTVAGFLPLNANSSGDQFSWQGVNGSAYVQAIDCSGNEEDPLFRTALWSQGPATLRLRLPPGEKIVTMYVGNCYSDQSGVFSPYEPGPPSGWLGKMAPKVAVTSVSLVDSTGAERPTLTPVLLGDRAFSGFYSPRSFRGNVSSNGYVDLRLTGSTGTSFLNYISWTLSAVVVHDTVGGSAQVGPKETAALAQSDRLATAGVRDMFWIGPFDDQNATGALDRISTDVNLTHTGKFGAAIGWRRWQQPDRSVRAPALPISWLLSGRPDSQNLTVGSVSFATTQLLCETAAGCQVVLEVRPSRHFTPPHSFPHANLRSRCGSGLDQRAWRVFPQRGECVGRRYRGWAPTD